MSPAKSFDRPITDLDRAERLAEVVADATAKRGRAPSRASTSIVGDRIRCVLDFTSTSRASPVT